MKCWLWDMIGSGGGVPINMDSVFVLFNCRKLVVRVDEGDAASWSVGARREMVVTGLRVVADLRGGGVIFK